MKQFIGIGLLVLFVLPSAEAKADEDYFSTNIGFALLGDSDVSNSAIPPTGMIKAEHDTGFVVNAAFGHQWYNYRAEAEVSYQKNNVDKMGGLPTGDVTAASLFFNMYYDLVNASQIIPFVGGGLGISSVSVSDLLLAGNDANDEVFAFQFFAGLGYVANDRITLDLQYRYFGTEDPYYADLTKYDISSHNIMVGARFSY